MGQAMGSSGVHSAVPCETSQMQASLLGPLPWLGSCGTGCPLRFLSLTASLPCTHHTCTHPAFIQSPRCHATGDLGAGSAQAEPRVWARECEWGHSLSPSLLLLHLSSLSSSVSQAPPFLLLLHLFLLSLLLLYLSSSRPPPLQRGKGNRGVCPWEGPRPGAQLWSPAGWGGGVAALTLGSLLVGAGKRGRRNSVGSLDSTIEVSASSCPTLCMSPALPPWRPRGGGDLLLSPLPCREPCGCLSQPTTLSICPQLCLSSLCLSLSLSSTLPSPLSTPGRTPSSDALGVGPREALTSKSCSLSLTKSLCLSGPNMLPACKMGMRRRYC